MASELNCDVFNVVVLLVLTHVNNIITALICFQGEINATISLLSILEQTVAVVAEDVFNQVPTSILHTSPSPSDHQNTHRRHSRS